MTDIASSPVVRLLQTLRRMEADKRVVAGAQAVHMDGPGGEWKLKMYRNGRGYTHLNVSVPRHSSPLYSVQAVVDVLVGEFGVDSAIIRHALDLPLPPPLPSPTPPHQQPAAQSCEVEDAEVGQDALVEPLTVASDPRSVRAALRLQTTARAFLLRMATRRVKDLHAQMESAAARVGLAHVAYKITDVAEADFCRSAPDVRLLPNLSIRTNELPSVPVPVVNILGLMTHPTDLDRDKVEKYAKDLMDGTSPKTTIFKTAKAVLRSLHYPLIIGSLPLPDDETFDWQYNGCRTFVRTSRVIGTDHGNLLKTTFGEKWLRYCETIVSTRNVCAFDMYADRHLRNYRCSILLSKFLVRIRGKVYPAIHIDSMASSQRRSGNGSRMMDLCKTLLFSDGTDIAKGFLFAQCLKIDFWEYRLHEDPRAQAMIMQMYMMFSDYAFEPHCIMKLTEVENEDDHAPSPAKKLV